MDEKRSLEQEHSLTSAAVRGGHYSDCQSPQAFRLRPTRSKVHPFKVVFIAIWTGFALWVLFKRFYFSGQVLTGGSLDLKNIATTPAQAVTDLSRQTRKVAVEAHIMSKCPDAKACLEKLLVPAMEVLEGKVDFEMNFIGDSDPDSDAVTCKHGPGECLGNTIILCAAHLYPETKLSLGYANCLIHDFQEIPGRGLVQTCAMEHGLDFGKINDCISDAELAHRLLTESVDRSAAAKIGTSCTIRLQQDIWCVTGDQRDCDDSRNLTPLIEDIETEFQRHNL